MILLVLLVSILLCIGIILSYYGIKNLKAVKQIKVEKNNEEEKLKELKNQIEELSNNKIELLEYINNRKKQIDLEFETEKEHIKEQFELYKNNTSYASEQYIDSLEKQYSLAEERYKKKILQLNQEYSETQKKLDKLRSSLSAGVAAQLREKEKEEQIEFYKLQLSDDELADVVALNNIKTTLHFPVVISKIIWSQYFQKQSTELCNRILGPNVICGIYKITNLKTKQCYVGQSINIANRFKEHMKCGLGIDAPATNKLYNAMQKFGIWNFSFELLEKCSKELLNEKESFFINLYQSDKFGYNATKGNK